MVNPPQLRRIEDIWFDDGNVVLQAGSAQYRVYRGTLARKSPIFSDMFCIGQPSGAELVDGCPLVIMPDDEADMTPFLQALFDAEFFPAFPARTTVSTIHGCLRLAHKYDVAGLRYRALLHLSSRFRTRLADHNTSRYYECWEGMTEQRLTGIATWPAPSPEALAATLALARQVDAPWVLPSVWYHLATLEPEQISGLTKAGALSSGDAALVAKGHQINLDAVAVILHAFEVATSPEECTLRKYCAPSRREVVQPGALNELIARARDPFATALYMRDVLDDMENVNEEVCASCAAGHNEAMVTKMQELWGQLPTLYGLPGWGTLRHLKTEAIGYDMI
ncbi:hypothetical protein MKEN_01373500 [Mycena kentingensis (nom. inval.)]|nr:hypothetical protein MKEN_01373500 [Mycena kentingensis (nom. inval.)]